MKKLKHYLFNGYNDMSILWCRANTFVLIFGFLLLLTLFSLVGGSYDEI